MFEFKKSTPEFFDEFISLHCEIGDWKNASSSELVDCYSQFCLSKKVRPPSSNVVGDYLRAKGFEPVRIRIDSKQMRAWYGIELKQPSK